MVSGKWGVAIKRNVVGLEDEEVEVLLEEDLDVYTRSLNQSQFESLVIILANRQRMTVKAIQRTIEYSYIFEFLEEIKKELDEESNLRYDRIRDSHRVGAFGDLKMVDEWKDVNIVAEKQSILDKVLQEKHTRDKLLRKEIDVFIGVQPHGKTTFGRDLTGFKNFMLSNDRYGSPEMKRSGVVSEINKHSSLKIPSYNTISKGLEELRYNGYLDYTSAKTLRKNEEKVRTRANGVWQVTDIFYRAWSRRRLNILADYEKEATQKGGGSDSVLAGFVEKYSARLLDIYLIKVSERIGYKLSSSIYLTHQAEVAEVFRD
jgi:hypothetical protein